MHRRDPVCSPTKQQKSNLFLQSGKGKTISSLFTLRNFETPESIFFLDLVAGLESKFDFVLLRNFLDVGGKVLFVWPHWQVKSWK
jgi:hypothetical protein